MDSDTRLMLEKLPAAEQYKPGVERDVDCM